MTRPFMEEVALNEQVEIPSSPGMFQFALLSAALSAAQSRLNFWLPVSHICQICFCRLPTPLCQCACIKLCMTWKRSYLLPVCIHSIEVYCMCCRDMLFSPARQAAPFPVPWWILMVASMPSWLLPMACPMALLLRTALALHLVSHYADCSVAACTCILASGISIAYTFAVCEPHTLQDLHFIITLYMLTTANALQHANYFIKIKFSLAAGNMANYKICCWLMSSVIALISL